MLVMTSYAKNYASTVYQSLIYIRYGRQWWVSGKILRKKNLIFNFQNNLSGRPALTFGQRPEKATSFGRNLLVLAN